MRETFGEAVRRLRMQSGLTMRDLARRAHVDPGHLSRIEGDRRRATPDLADVLDRVLETGGYLRNVVAEPDGLAIGESVRLTQLLTQSSASDLVAGLVDGTRGLAVAYLSSRPAAMLKEAGALRRTAVGALRSGRVGRPGEVADTLLHAGYLSGILAYAALDLGDPKGAMTHAEAAWAAGEAVGSNDLRAWVRGTQSLIERFAGRYPRALEYAEDGLRYAGEASSGRIRLLCGVAQCHANLGGGALARAALDEADRVRDRVEQPDRLPGLFGFSPAKQHYYAGSALIWLDDAADLRRAREGAHRALALWAVAGPDRRALDDEALARVYLATASLRLGEVEAAVDALRPILELPPERRISWIRKRLGRVNELLGAKPYAGEPLAQHTRAQIAEYR